MSLQQIMQSFCAFNQNAYSNLAYIFRSNFWLILMMAASIAIIVLNLKYEIEDTVTEEQNII